MYSKIIMAAVLVAAGNLWVCAQETTQVENNGSQGASQATTQSTSQAGSQAAPGSGSSTFVNSEGEPTWSLNMDYSGFEFQVPAGSVVERGSSFVSKYPDGSFGLSMKNETKAANQKIAFETCKRLAQELRIPNPDVRKMSYGKCRGARAIGKLDGRLVSVIVLPYDDQQITAVVMASPEREEWLNQFMRSLKKK